MPLYVLLALVIGGIAAITGLLHLTGKSRRRILMPEDARGEWHRHFPDDNIIDVTVSRDGHAALIRAEEGPGLLWALGADTVARRLIDYDMVEYPDGLRVMFHDFSAPHVALNLSEEERDTWQSLIENG
ncbi:hypothetical protein [Primorskyibacter sp. S87]|uniref:hypothetical protein n=1 Tax=Primorskyibacter sp. S87 TaxID=3415126 RepID=UPI003C7E89CB